MFAGDLTRPERLDRYSCRRLVCQTHEALNAVDGRFCGRVSVFDVNFLPNVFSLSVFFFCLFLTMCKTCMRMARWDEAGEMYLLCEAPCTLNESYRSTDASGDKNVCTVGGKGRHLRSKPNVPVHLQPTPGRFACGIQSVAPDHCRFVLGEVPTGIGQLSTICNDFHGTTLCSRRRSLL